MSKHLTQKQNKAKQKQQRNHVIEKHLELQQKQQQQPQQQQIISKEQQSVNEQNWQTSKRPISKSLERGLRSRVICQ